MSNGIDWTDAMLATLRSMRADGHPITLCAEKIGVCYPVTFWKARELQLNRRMNVGRRKGVDVIADQRVAS